MGPSALLRRRAAQGSVQVVPPRAPASSRSSRTRLLDHVEFAAPLGVLGRAAERLVLARYLRRLIDVRNTFLVTEATRLSATKGSAGGG